MSKRKLLALVQEHLVGWVKNIPMRPYADYAKRLFTAGHQKVHRHDWLHQV